MALKEHRKLIICPHETPLNEIHLENMAKLARMGAYIVPPMPSFYHRPQNADDIVEQFACRVMELCGIEDAAYRRWKTENDKKRQHALTNFSCFIMRSQLLSTLPFVLSMDFFVGTRRQAH